MGDTGIRRSIIHCLSHEYPDLYTHTNIALVATHSHAGVGGYLENLLPHIALLGYVPQTAEAIVEGTVLAVRRANINRSLSAYLANPEEERAQYEADVDKEMAVLRFEDAEGSTRGFLSFFPVHGTSLYQNNTLINGDNKGMAAYLYEAMVEPDAIPGQTNFIAGFTQSSAPSARALGSLGMASRATSSTPRAETRRRTAAAAARASAPRTFESNRIIAQLQVDGARSVMDRPEDMMPVAGPVKAVHTHADFAVIEMSPRRGEYTLRTSDILNVIARESASHFPGNTVAPDLGPKMYNTMASSESNGSKGSTRLHMDMADAANIMLYAAPPVARAMSKQRGGRLQDMPGLCVV
ncbi:Neutral/alkaline non-lysosomal ceramidase-domain-containing protein [Fomitopsis serialis]|uniref:Neutral/alkaline non-lysosomal ceramidase-domain-containing protein n=1 Tax=Fomitopsis serialis TaxID=139415 RepID=UPI002008D222|nr:Neutral/alkaline non-lysosomal ceramidase-domain-containing protein [Neoantrodia serialis]KAH9914130.1 Neutral/alkaline non-lysosomal ceramidase-domain-containing protein [Neoantrodia serialis]